jgi:hypothetical protein
MRKSVLKSSIAALMIIACQQIVQAQETVKVGDLGNLERVVVLAVQQEVEANSLKTRSDLCIGFGHGLAVDEKAVMSKLKRVGLRLHPVGWCNGQARGLSIAIIAPIRETSPGTYEFTLELGDLSPLRKGEHFATLLKRGTYVIRCDKDSEPHVVSYRQTCCKKTS